MLRFKLARGVLVLVVLGFALAQCVPARATGLLAYWPMDEGSGTTTADQSGGGHNGTLVGSAAWDTGRFGSGVNFAATAGGNRIDAGGSLALGTGDFTISFWEKSGVDVNGQKWFMGFNYNDNGNPDVMLTGIAGRLTVFTGGVYTASAVLYGAPDDVIGDGWYHVALTRTGTTLTSYVNGALDGTGTYAGNLQPATGSNTNLGQGADWWYSLPGTLDDVAIWSQALSATQIANLAAGTVTPLNVLAPEPSTLALLAAGLLSLVVYAWRKRG